MSTGCGPGPAAEPLVAGGYLFRRAAAEHELEQVHRLNHRTFVGELAQHADEGSGRLVDKFHDKNVYLVALSAGAVVGMVALHDEPPFSIAARLPDPRALDGLGPRPLEVRLLAVAPAHRHGPVFAGLGRAALRHAQEHGHSHLLISGLVERARLYERLGFRPLGPPVAEGGARFVPMAARVSAIPARDVERLDARWEAAADVGDDGDGLEGPSPGGPGALVSLTPAHAQLSGCVRRAFARAGLDHRGPEVLAAFREVRGALAALAGAAEPALFAGTGTFANDVVACTLRADPRTRRGLVLANGEFGRRLAVQARRWGLAVRVLERPWGAAWDLAEVGPALDGCDWVWTAHLETSTGMVNDLSGLIEVAGGRGVRVCLDAVSSLGGLPVDLSRVHLASAVSNKALGGVAGLCAVFASPDAAEGLAPRRLPESLDLRAALASPAPRFTLPSGPLFALQAALRDAGDAGARRCRFARAAALGRRVRRELRALGMAPVVEGPRASALVTSFRPPPGVAAPELLEAARAWGFALGGGSGYLRRRGWLQLSTFGAVTATEVSRFFVRLAAWGPLSSRGCPSSTGRCRRAPA